MTRVVVGSANAVKVAAVADAFARCGLTVAVEGVAVPSGVSEQPMTLTDTLTGARNRATATAAACPDADFVVGMEGGCFEVEAGWFEAGWIVIRSGGIESVGSTVWYPVPDQVLVQLLAGRDLDEAMEALVGIEDIGSSSGFYAYMTDGAIDRARGYADATAVALTRFLHPELWS